MSVTVADLLRLPSLRQAKVVAGHGGLSKIVSSISVLESTDPGVLVEEVFPQGEYFGSEIVITGFLNMTEDVDRQYINMKRLAEGGEVGLIFYYVGVYLKKIHQRLIDFANEMDFVLIVMPEGDVTLRYGEVISDVMDLILRDRTRNTSLVSEILERVSSLPAHQRTVSTILKMLSDRISASLILCDGSFQIQYLCAWPRSAEASIKKGLRALNSLPADQKSAACDILPDSRLYHFCVGGDRGPRFELLVLREGMPLDSAVLAELKDVVHLGVSIWGQEQGEVAIHELIRAILQDEPMKMQQLANIFHINVADIHEMWILHCEEEELERFRREGLPLVREHLGHYCHTVVADLYEGRLVAFMDWIEHSPERIVISGDLLEHLKGLDFSLSLTRCYPLNSTSDVRRTFLLHQETIGTAKRIWPDRGCYTLSELEFAADCRKTLSESEAALSQALLPLEVFTYVREDNALLKTLEVYLLDAGGSTSVCAELLFLHKNTVKYRLSRIRDLLGYPLDKAPELFSLYRAMALDRLLASK
ncbi:MAG: PucR family transcriptional regulator [Lachnospiraceae bacterium]|jgi:DNA-binding PucR family transcriptional regulator|nr:PucR family transcriptional regulator [Lachnospiraceae bacterium]